MLTKERAFEETVVTRKVQALYMQAQVSNITVLAITLLYYFFLRSRLDTELLGMWALVMFVTSGIRLLLWTAYRKNENARSQRFWLNSYTVGSFFVGTSFSLVQLLLHDFTDLVALVSLLMLVFGVLSSAVSVMSPHLPAFFLYTVPQVFIVSIALLRLGEPEVLAPITALFIYLIMLSLFARNAHRNFIESQRLISTNQALVEELHSENDQREAIIQERTQALKATNDVLEEEIEQHRETQKTLSSQQESLQKMAHHDALTGLPNRLLLNDRISQSVLKSRRDDSLHAVMFIDLDNFKQINDSLGHTTGDKLLESVAGRLLRCVREEDTVARLGGDEFILLIENFSDLQAINRMAEKILVLLRIPLEIAEQSFTITASIGIAVHPGDGDDAETLLRNADSAMYRAKADGRNSFRFYSAEMTEQAREKLIIRNNLLEAVQNRQLELYYQPQICLNNGRLIGAEVLLRWHHPELGLMLPGTFIPIAEESDLINRLGRWVLNNACDQLRSWQDRGISDFSLSVNVASRQIRHDSLMEDVEAALTASHCDPAMLELEITESSLMEQPDQARELLQALRTRGISIAVDDFGTGYSSLSYLKHYPISKLKIDKSFVSDISNDADDLSIVRAVIALGHSLGLTVIAEGVETLEQITLLRQESCDQVQGYIYGRPMAARDFENLLQTHRPEFQLTDAEPGPTEQQV